MGLEKRKRFSRRSPLNEPSTGHVFRENVFGLALQFWRLCKDLGVCACIRSQYFDVDYLKEYFMVADEVKGDERQKKTNVSFRKANIGSWRAE